jgi:DNA-binding PadR family transcriptional regulator
MTLDGLGRLGQKGGQPHTASAVRRFLRIEHPVGLNPVLRSLKELLRRGLVRIAGITEERPLRLYQLTSAGERIVTQLRR